MNNPLKGSACQSTPWNKGKLVGQKAPASRKRNLGNSRSLGNLRQGPRLGSLQLGHRQQIAWVRLGPDARQRCLPWRPCRSAGQRNAAED